MRYLLFSMIFLINYGLFSQETEISDAELVQNEKLMRSLGKDIFQLNGVPFVQPMVEAVNAISNDGFYNTAYLKSGKDSWSFGFKIHTMFGSVPNSKQWYKPELPREAFALTDTVNPENGLYGHAEINLFPTPSFSIKDTAGLYYYLFKTIINDGILSGEIVPPTRSATLLGKSTETFNFRDGLLGELARKRVDSINQKGEQLGFQPISDSLTDQIVNTLNGLPSTIALPEGGNINNIFAAVPQINIGMPYGTELSFRYIPEINYGKNIGDFGFWGFGLKHNLSQWWNEENNPEELQVAVQLAMQGTSLTNVMEITGTEFKADAIMTNVNLHFSQRLFEYLDAFGGISYESINIENNYTYYLSHQIQVELYGRYDDRGDGDIPKTSKEFSKEEIDEKANKDNKPQTDKITLDAEQLKFTFGLYSDLEDFDIYLAYSFSEFNIFNFGMSYKLDFSGN